jgi:hypothetical protein
MAASRGRHDDPVPPPLPVPMCHCGIPAQVKKSRDEATTRRAFYTCPRKWILNEDGGPSQYNIAPCFFHQWIDGPEKFDPRIRLFPWIESVVQPYHESRRWVTPHQSHRKWHSKKNKRRDASVLATLHCVIVGGQASCNFLILTFS